MAEAHNYCRNADDDDLPWCVSGEGPHWVEGQNWGYCDHIPEC